MTTAGSPLLALLHLCDSLFPLGGFAHSDGLETATTDGTVRTVDDLHGWMDGCLDETLAHAEGPAVLLAYQAYERGDWASLERLDIDLYAMRPSSAGRAATRTMGSRLLRTWQRIHPESSVEALPEACRALTLPVAFGAVCAASAIDVRAALEGFMYLRLAAISSAAMRLMAIGQHDAHELLGRLLERVPAQVDGVLERAEQPWAFAPAYDIAAMSQQYVHSRLFRS